MEGYINYTEEFNDIIGQQQTIIENQEKIIEQLQVQNNTAKVISVLIMVIILTKLVLRMFGIRWG